MQTKPRWPSCARAGKGVRTAPHVGPAAAPGTPQQTLSKLRLDLLLSFLCFRQDFVTFWVLPKDASGQRTGPFSIPDSHSPPCHCNHNLLVQGERSGLQWEKNSILASPSGFHSLTLSLYPVRRHFYAVSHPCNSGENDGLPE